METWCLKIDKGLYITNYNPEFHDAKNVMNNGIIMVISWDYNDDLMGFYGDLVGLTVYREIFRDLMGINVDLVGLIL